MYVSLNKTTKATKESDEEFQMTKTSYVSHDSLPHSLEETEISKQPLLCSFKKHYKKEDHTYELILADNDTTDESILNERRPSIPDILSPFKICWTFGYNKTVPLLNLTLGDTTTIVFSSSHVVVIYDYSTKEAQFLQGHKNSVTSLSVDQTGQWLVSADLGEDSAVIIWDTHTCNPVDTLFNVYEDGTKIVGMSPNAHYLVTVSPWVEQKLQLFMWTLGKTEPDATLDITPDCGPVRKLHFNSNCCEHFSLTTDSKILFISYENNELNLHIGSKNLTSKVGQYTDSTYVPDTHLFLSATSTGHVLMWSDVDYNNSFNNFGVTNKKKVLKHVQLVADGITHICAIDNVIAIVNGKGQISFYDRTLLLLYWIDLVDVQPLISLSFHLEHQKSDITEKEIIVNLETKEVPKRKLPKIASDATSEKKPFFVRDFIIGTVTGKICYVNYIEKIAHDLIDAVNEEFTTMDITPGHDFFCCGNAGGYCMLYDFKKKIFISKQLLKNEEQLFVPQQSAVNYVKYSPCGKELACGKADGSLWLLDPILLKPRTNIPVIYTPAPISKITFSYDSKYLAHADFHHCISLYILTEDTITLVGVFKAHYKPITDLMFLKNLSLFSIGEDGQLVEFNINTCCSQKELVVESIHTVEPSAIPLCMFFYPLSKAEENMILIANSEYKFKLFLESNKKCCKTILTQILSSPVSSMEILPSCSSYLIFATDNHIGIQKLPLDGNPYKSLAIIGSSSRIIKICISSDGSYVFTLGVNGHNIFMWNINTKCVDYFEWTGGKGLKPYYGLIQGDRDGHLWNNIIDYFCVGQILHQGEHPSIMQTLSNEIPICELSDVMRAVGFFPTEREVHNMYYEVLSNIQNQPNTRSEHTIKFDDFVRLYINHRNAIALTKEQLEEAFLTFSDEENLEKSVVLKPMFFNALRKRGEPMKSKEIVRYLTVLCGITSRGRTRGNDVERLLPFLPQEITFQYFFNTVLGFEIEPKAELNQEETTSNISP